MFTKFESYSFLWSHIFANHKKPNRGGIIMDNALNMIGGLVKSLTSILVGVVGLGVVAGVVFGDTWFFGDVLNNLVALIQGLGDAGLVGLLAAAILIGLLK